MSRIMVTGGAGFVGSHMVEYLVKQGHNVIATDIKEFPEVLKELAELYSLQLVKADLVTDDMGRYMLYGDKILHLGAVAHFVTQEKIHDAVSVNVLGTVRLIEAAIRKKVDRIVYASTGSVYAQPVSPPIREDHPLGPTWDNYYGWSKLMAEQWLRNLRDKIPSVILRYAYVYGTRKDWGAIGKWLHKDIPNNTPPAIYGGQQSNDFIYIKDLVEANALALDTHNLNQVFNIGTGAATSIWDACGLCLKTMKSSLKPHVKATRTFDYSAFFYEITKARVILGFEPKWTIERGIDDMVHQLLEGVD